MSRRVWTAYRAWMSNLIPLLLVAPLPPIAYWLDNAFSFWYALPVWALFPFALWLSINFFGLFQNEKMKRELSHKKPSGLYSVFCGFRRPSASVYLHPHEDLGWFVIGNDFVEFIGDRLNYKLQKNEVTAIRLVPNINSLLFLGGWVCIEARSEGKRLRMLIEPRENRTMTANRKLRRELAKQLREKLIEQR